MIAGPVHSVVDQDKNCYTPWEWCRIVGSYLYFLRVVLLAAIAMVGISTVAKRTSAKALLEGLFDLNALQIFMVSLTAFLTTWSLTAITILILINGGERFRIKLDIADGDEIGHLIRTKLSPIIFFLCSLLAVPLIVHTCMVSTSALGWKLLAAAGGLVVAIIILQVVLFLYYLLLNSEQLEQSPRIFDSPRLSWLRKLARRANPTFLPRLLRGMIAWLIERLPRRWGRGFFPFDSQGNRISCFYPGHLFALTTLLVTLIFYVSVGLWKSMNLGTLTIFPTLAYALLLLMLLCWLFSGITFVFDRYRVPVLLLMVGWGIVTATLFSAWSDYTYDVIRKSGQPTVSADQVVNAPQAAANERAPATMIVVASNGGGIQAAAWTARVLTGLECQARKELPDTPRRFGDSIRLISSVSGGSVGAMYFVNAYTSDGLPATQAGLEHIVDQAMASSIDEIGYGAVYSDLWHSFLPNPLLKSDRGKALERAWQHIGMLQAANADDLERAPNDRSEPSQDCPDVGEAAAQTPPPPLTNGLETWREGVTAGWRPATIFNATIADTGERLLFSTVNFPVIDKKLRQPQIFGSSRLYCGYDISVATAARLSATFPYVTPAARAAIDQSDAAAASQACPSAAAPPRFHIVDGGYYDNYGMATLTEWLDTVLLDQKRRGAVNIKKVLVIQIRGAPDPAGRPYSCIEQQPPATAEAASAVAEEGLNKRRDNPRGWFYQIFAPVATLLHVRDSGQGAHNDVEFDLLQRTWASDVEISTVTFQYIGPDTPLNWHLTKAQKENIQAAWDRQKGCKEWQQVKQFLSNQ